MSSETAQPTGVAADALADTKSTILSVEPTDSKMPESKKKKKSSKSKSSKSGTQTVQSGMGNRKSYMRMIGQAIASRGRQGCSRTKICSWMEEQYKMTVHKPSFRATLRQGEEQGMWSREKQHFRCNAKQVKKQTTAKKKQSKKLQQKNPSLASMKKIPLKRGKSATGKKSKKTGQLKKQEGRKSLHNQPPAFQCRWFNDLPKKRNKLWAVKKNSDNSVKSATVSSDVTFTVTL